MGWRGGGGHRTSGAVQKSGQRTVGVTNHRFFGDKNCSHVKQNLVARSAAGIRTQFQGAVFLFKIKALTDLQ